MGRKTELFSVSKQCGAETPTGSEDRAQKRLLLQSFNDGDLDNVLRQSHQKHINTSFYPIGTIHKV